MCRDCGCGLPGENPVGVSAHHREHEHAHHHHADHEHHSHTHDHDHPHDHSHGPGLDSRRTIELRQAILAKNDRLAERNRGFFFARGLLVLNVLSSPGSGKTTFLRETVRALAPELKAGIIVGDLATDNDAESLRQTGAPVAQITTGTVCHLEAEMVSRALQRLDLKGLNLLIIENVGNLVCPASYDLGEHLRVVLLSVTEGEDKPLKYPPIFQAANAIVISKMDLATACGFDRKTVLSNIHRMNPQARVFEVSAKTGEGMDGWRRFVLEQHLQRKSSDPPPL